MGDVVAVVVAVVVAIVVDGIDFRWRHDQSHVFSIVDFHFRGLEPDELAASPTCDNRVVAISTIVVVAVTSIYISNACRDVCNETCFGNPQLLDESGPSEEKTFFREKGRILCPFDVDDLVV